MLLSKKALLALLPFFLQVNSQTSGTGVTTRYWDCCKPSCGWAGKATLAAGPVTSCDINDEPVSADTQSACPSGSGGSSYMCSTQQPWAVSDTLAYGFAATSIVGGTEATWCCACYALTFTSTSISGKTLIVQSTNTGSDLGSNQFDLAMPGGGFGLFDGCVSEWGIPSAGWGAQYGGISDRSDCDAFPVALQPGCYWRFDWFENVNNPTVSFQQVECPAALTTKSGCLRANDSIGEAPTGASVLLTTLVTGGAAATSSCSGSSTTTAAGSMGVGSSGSSGTAARYGQCGGTGWAGPTTCVSPYTCTYSNAYYSQCL